MRLNVGVIFGGKNVEHEISIISAVEAMGYADPNKYKIIPIYIDKNNDWYTGGHLSSILNYRDIDVVKRYAKKVALIKNDNCFVLQSTGLFKRNLFVIDVVVPIGHGTFLEDGSLQGYLNMIGVPYAGPNVLGGAIGQDKVVQKQLLSYYGVPVVKYEWFYDYEFKKDSKKILDKLDNLKYPLFIKPANLGSSVGIEIAHKKSDLAFLIKNVMKYDKKIIVEETVNNLKEVNISVLGDYEKQEISEIEEINSNSDFYSFKEKYVNDFSKTKKNKKTKPIISKEMMEDIKKYALNTYRVLNASGVARIDFLIDEKTLNVYVGEINTIPGSLAGYLWLPKKKDQTELFDDLIALAFKNKDHDKELVKVLPGNLLERYDTLKGNKNNKK